jgi:CelD/BcsL family acetyltransferase involved in cellulose biosynthesis
MIVDEIRDHEALMAVREEWASLTQRVSSRNPFVTPQFMLPYLRHIGTRYDCRVLIARENDRMIGFCPTFMRRSGRASRLLRRISFPTHGTSPPFELVIEDGREDVIAAFVEHWKKSSDWHLIELQNVPATSQTEAMLETAVSRAGLRLTSIKQRTSLYVRAVGTWEQYWRSIPKKSRAASKRSQRLCSELGEVRIVAYPTDFDDTGRATEWIRDITRRSWKTRDESTGAGTSMAAYVADLVGGGLLEILFVQINNRPVAYLINILYKRQLNAFHTAYDLDYMPQGPSVLLLHHSIQECFQMGYSLYDLLGERQLHVRRWSSTFMQYSDLRITRRTPWSRVRADLYCRIRDARMRRARQSTDDEKTEAKGAAHARRAGGNRAADAGEESESSN